MRRERELVRFGQVIDGGEGFRQGLNEGVSVPRPENYRGGVVYDGMPSVLPRGVQAVEAGVPGVGMLLTAAGGVLDHCPVAGNQVGFEAAA